MLRDYIDLLFLNVIIEETSFRRCVGVSKLLARLGQFVFQPLRFIDVSQKVESWLFLVRNYNAIKLYKTSRL